MKMPAFQFYPADWRKDPGVQALNRHDRSVWFDMLCIMHESDERGVLLLAGRPVPEDALARMLNLDNQTFNQTLTNILTYGVASRRQSDGAIYSRRMVKDESLCQVRREAGKKGGNPGLVNQKAKQNPTTGVNQSPTPSSSSSISSSSSEKETTSSLRSEVAAPEEKKIGASEVSEPHPAERPPAAAAPGGATDVGTGVLGDGQNGQNGQNGQKPAETDISDTKPDTVKLTRQRGGKPLKAPPGSSDPADYELPEWAGPQFVAEFGGWLATRQSRTDCKPLTAKAVQARLKELAGYDEQFCAGLFRQAEQNPHWQGLTFDNTPHKFTQHVLAIQKLQTDAARQNQPAPGAKPTSAALDVAEFLARRRFNQPGGGAGDIGQTTGAYPGQGPGVASGFGPN